MVRRKALLERAMVSDAYLDRVKLPNRQDKSAIKKRSKNCGNGQERLEAAPEKGVNCSRAIDRGGPVGTATLNLTHMEADNEDPHSLHALCSLDACDRALARRRRKSLRSNICGANVT